jgi:Pectate lyase superfamily protein
MPNYSEILNLYLPNRVDAIEVDVSLAENFQKIDDAFGDLDLSFGVTPEQFGALGNGASNDTTAFQNAVNEAISTKQALRLKAGATYLISSSISINGDIKIVTDGKPNATIKSNSQTFIPLTATGTIVATRTLSADVSANQNYATLNSTTGAQRGDIAIFRSNRVWHFDPRTDGVVSQVNKIHEVSGTTIHLEDQHIESYDISAETVEVDIIRPIRISIEGVSIVATKASEGSSSNIVGIQAYHLTDSKIEDVHIQDCQGAGISLRDSYNVVVRDSTTDGTNYLASGYGVQFVGVAHGLAERVKSTNCRRGVDVSGLAHVSTYCKVKNCIMTNSGKDSEGDRYGWWSSLWIWYTRTSLWNSV